MSASVLDILRAIWLKDYEIYPTFARARVMVPAGRTVGGRIIIPDTEVWLVIEELRGDIPHNVFAETCKKDQKDIFPFGVVIGREQIDFRIHYASPWIVEEYIEWSAENTDAVDHWYELTMYYAVIPRKWMARFRRIVGFMDDQIGIAMDEWDKMSRDEKTKWVIAHGVAMGRV